MKPAYTPAEARALEDHYIACAMREGIWGKGVMPKMVEKVPQNPDRKHANTLIGIKNRKRVLTAIRRGVRTCPHIANVLSIPSGSARKACRELEKEGKIKRQGFTTVNSSQTTLWAIVSP